MYIRSHSAAKHHIYREATAMRMRNLSVRTRITAIVTAILVMLGGSVTYALASGTDPYFSVAPVSGSLGCKSSQKYAKFTVKDNEGQPYYYKFWAYRLNSTTAFEKGYVEDNWLPNNGRFYKNTETLETPTRRGATITFLVKVWMLVEETGQYEVVVRKKFNMTRTSRVC